MVGTRTLATEWSPVPRHRPLPRPDRGDQVEGARSSRVNDGDEPRGRRGGADPGTLRRAAGWRPGRPQRDRAAEPTRASSRGHDRSPDRLHARRQSVHADHDVADGDTRAPALGRARDAIAYG